MSNKNFKLDKYKLYFDRNRKIYIEFTLEKIRTCKDLYTFLQKEIEKKTDDIYGKEKQSKIFGFILINSKINSKSDSNSPSIELKLENKMQLVNILILNQYYLCYLPINKNDIKYKKEIIKKCEEKGDNTFGVELESLLTHKLEKYLNNEGVYWFDKNNREFLFGKGYIDEKKIEINTKQYKIKIKINAIRKDEYFENQIPPILNILDINEIKMPKYMIIIYHNNVSHIIGLFHQKSYNIWKNAINLAKTKYNNFYVHSTFKSNITTYNYQHFIRSQSIPKKLFDLKQIMENYEKREIFLEAFPDKKIADIISNIYLYKNHFKDNKFFQAWMCLQKISFHVDFNNINDELQKNQEIEKYSKIFTSDKINLYNDLVKLANDVMSKINNSQNFEEEMNNALGKIFKNDLFDQLYYEIYEMYIEPLYNNIKEKLNIEYKFDQKPYIIMKYHLLLSKYCIKFFDMSSIDNFNILCTTSSTKNVAEYNNFCNNIRVSINNNTSNTDINSNNAIYSSSPPKEISNNLRDNN